MLSMVDFMESLSSDFPNPDPKCTPPAAFCKVAHEQLKALDCAESLSLLAHYKRGKIFLDLETNIGTATSALEQVKKWGLTKKSAYSKSDSYLSSQQITPSMHLHCLL
jgi:hypothetical protein